jgi:hypothetical protein
MSTAIFPVLRLLQSVSCKGDDEVYHTKNITVNSFGTAKEAESC